MSETDFAGRWHFAYWYPSNDHEGDDVSEYDVEVRQAGRALVFESQATKDKSYMFARLTPVNGVYSGTWFETTSPTGAFGGAHYSGAGQLLLSDDGQRLDGMWAGAGYDHDTQQMRIYSGKWVISRQPAPTPKIKTPRSWGG